LLLNNIAQESNVKGLLPSRPVRAARESTITTSSRKLTLDEVIKIGKDPMKSWFKDFSGHIYQEVKLA
jgi:hypothetical protein